MRNFQSGGPIKKYHVFLLLLVAMIGLTALFSNGLRVQTDSYHYIGAGVSFVEGNGFYYHNLDHAEPQPMIRHAPITSLAYALLLGIGMELAWVAVAITVLSWGALLMATYLLGKAVTNSVAVGLAGAVLVAVNWSVLRVAGWALSEMLFLPFISLALWQAGAYPLAKRNISWRPLLLITLWLTLAMSVRYIGIVALGAVGLAFVMARLRQRLWQPLIIEGGVLASSVLPVILWFMRNAQLTQDALGDGVGREADITMPLAQSFAQRTYQLFRLFIPGGYGYQLKQITVDVGLWWVLLLGLGVVCLVTGLLIWRGVIGRTTHWGMLTPTLLYLLLYFLTFIFVDTQLHTRWFDVRYFTPIAALLAPVAAVVGAAYTARFSPMLRSGLLLTFAVLYVAGMFLNRAYVLPQPVRTRDLTTQYEAVAAVTLNDEEIRSSVLTNFANPFLGYYDQVRAVDLNRWLMADDGCSAETPPIIVWAPQVVATHPSAGWNPTVEEYDQYSRAVTAHCPDWQMQDVGYARIYTSR